MKYIDILQSNHAGVFRYNNGEEANYGVIRIENGELVHYTGKGLREIWAPKTAEDKTNAEKLKSLSEVDLILSGHIAITPLSEIQEVLN